MKHDFLLDPGAGFLRAPAFAFQTLDHFLHQ
jgi:hypothetical protein